LIEKVSKNIISEIFDFIATETGLTSEEVGTVVKKWVECFNFWFDRRCFHCGKILDTSTIKAEISHKVITNKFI